MKKIGILNYKISSVISTMGHTDSIAIGDCGLPIPKETERIDLALIKDIPTFMQTLKAVLLELQIEEVEIANETKKVSPQLYEEMKKELGHVKINFITHEELKGRLRNCKAVIRTGEQTPYANIILKSGVVF
ncbi:D-ribose pyranase [uncultured Clostridium sp.]|uniref:D-ribose pyranase n=1 Tax=uncultured Clostridium sp. TaxID=59620 RepID=UPI0028EDA746|nr:D-ribose pyranase [uncultured Clostridium sp.]